MAAEGEVVQGNYAIEVFDNLRDNPIYAAHNQANISFHGDPVMINDLVNRPPQRQRLNKTVVNKKEQKKGSSSKLE